MTINYAILGLLSWKSMTGYDMKRIMQDSPIMYWSGNNNQIYKVLVQLLEQGFVTNKMEYQETAPNKKIYSITGSGQEALRKWIISTEPEMPEFKKNFLIQLSWAGQLKTEEIDIIAGRYEETVKQYIAMAEEERKRQKNFPNRSGQENYVWDMIYGNHHMTYEAELQWIRKFREGLQKWKLSEGD